MLSVPPGLSPFPYHFQKIIKQIFAICWAAGGFGMELNREKRLCFVPYTFVGSIVKVFKKRFPIAGERFVIDGKTVIL